MSNLNDMGYAPKADFTPIAIGNYDAIIHGVIGLGLNAVEFKGEKKTPAIFVKLVYEIPSLVRNDGQTTVIGQRLKISNHEKSKCYKLLKTIYGKEVNKDNALQHLNSEGLQKLLGRAVSIQVEHFEKEERSIPYVESVTQLDPRLPQPVATRGTVFFNPLKPDLEVFKNNVTASTQEQVMTALNADQFPAELHEAWAKIQEDAAQNSSNTASNGNGNTGSIE